MSSLTKAYPSSGRRSATRVPHKTSSLIAASLKTEQSLNSGDVIVTAHRPSSSCFAVYLMPASFKALTQVRVFHLSQNASAVDLGLNGELPVTRKSSICRLGSF